MNRTEPRLGDTFERFLALPTESLDLALSSAADLIASALAADKVDAFVHDDARGLLVALGSSHQPLSALEKQLGLDVLPIVNGGRVVDTFVTGEPHLSGSVHSDPNELRGVREALGIKSQIAVAVEVGGRRHGVLSVAGQKPESWGPDDLRFTQVIARWLGIVAHRAQLVAQLEQGAREQGRRAAAEELVTVVAHDLRNHLSPLDLRLNALKRRAGREQRTADARDLDVAIKSVARISDFITDLLDVARIDHGLFELKMEPFDLQLLAQEVASTTTTAEQPVVVQCAEPLQVRGDAARVRQCLENLLANALKHGPEGAPITLEITRQRHAHGEWARIDVIDVGQGIAAHLLPHIFDRFVSEQHARGAGLGLGLFLARRIALMHGGDLTVDSQPGRGARFSLTLALA